MAEPLLPLLSVSDLVLDGTPEAGPEPELHPQSCCHSLAPHCLSLPALLPAWLLKAFGPVTHVHLKVFFSFFFFLMESLGFFFSLVIAFEILSPDIILEMQFCFLLIEMEVNIAL